MITARQFKGGFVVKIQNELYAILGAQHTKPGKGGAFVKAKMKNLKSGAIAERTFRPDDTFEQAYIEQKKIQFLYKDRFAYHFMDQLTYEQIAVSEEMASEFAKFLKDGMEITALVHENTVVEITLPSFVNLKVTYTEPGIKGDTARGGSKAATLETGTVIKVPLFINTGNIIKIDTRTGAYSGRA